MTVILIIITFAEASKCAVQIGDVEGHIKLRALVPKISTRKRSLPSSTSRLRDGLLYIESQTWANKAGELSLCVTHSLLRHRSTP